VVVEHPRAVEQLLRERERAPGIAGQQHPVGELGGRAQVKGGKLGERVRGHEGREDRLAAMAKRGRRADAAEALRGAVDRTFQATVGQAQGTRDRAQEVVDELAAAATRVRDVIDDLRVASHDEVRELREQVAKLEARVAALEGGAAKGTARAKRTAAGRTATTGRKATGKPSSGGRGGAASR
jgi:polyhydroxyalkanoate synthesis regulator phasin